MLIYKTEKDLSTSSNQRRAHARTYVHRNPFLDFPSGKWKYQGNKSQLQRYCIVYIRKKHQFSELQLLWTLALMNFFWFPLSAFFLLITSDFMISFKDFFSKRNFETWYQIFIYRLILLQPYFWVCHESIFGNLAYTHQISVRKLSN